MSDEYPKTPVSVVIPAFNEEAAILGVIEHIRQVLGAAGIQHEIIIVVDGATDGTASVARQAADHVVEHPQNMGYGRSLKTGIHAAKYDRIAITDADGTYPAERLPELIQLSDRYDMVVGARTGVFYRGSQVKRIGRIVFRFLSEFAAGRRIPDINSGLRVFRKSHIVPFFPLINSGFSFTTTSTLVYLLNDLFIHYVPIEYHKRSGHSKVHHLRDSLRALQIIMEAILRCNPIKAFMLLIVPCVIGGLLLGLFGWLTHLSDLIHFASLLLCTSIVLTGLGFLAVALLPRSPVQPISVVNANARRSE